MKKILPALILIGFLAVLLLPQIASAVDVAAPETCTINRSISVTVAGRTITCGSQEEIGGENAICCIMNTLYSVTDWMFIVLVGVAGIFVIIGGMQIIMAGGNAEQVTTGRQYIMYAFIGLIVAFLAKAIPALVKLVGGF